MEDYLRCFSAIMQALLVPAWTKAPKNSAYGSFLIILI